MLFLNVSVLLYDTSHKELNGKIQRKCIGPFMDQTSVVNSVKFRVRAFYASCMLNKENLSNRGLQYLANSLTNAVQGTQMFSCNPLAGAEMESIRT